MTILIAGMFPDAKMFIPLCRDRGMRCVFLGSENNRKYQPTDTDPDIRYYYCNPSDNMMRLAAFIANVIDKENCSVVVPVSESLLLPVSLVCQRKGIKTLSSEVALLVRDKVKLRQKLSEKGVENIKWSLCTSVSEVQGFLGAADQDIILKPNYGQASESVYRVRTQQEAEHAFTDIRQSRLNRTEGVLCEQYVGGAEYSVEGYCLDGRYFPQAITKKYTDDALREIGHCQASDLSHRDSELVYEKVQQCLEATGFTNGVFHLEVKVDQGEVYLIEINGRPGGDHIPILTKITTGADLYLAQICIFSGAQEITPGTPLDHGAAIAYRMARRDQIVKYVRSEEAENQLRQDAKYAQILSYFRAGDTVKDDISRLFGVIVSGRTGEEAYRTAQAQLEAVEYGYV